MLRTSHHIYKAALGSVALAGVLLGLGPTDAQAQLATNVVCFRCVGNVDIARHAVTQSKLAAGAVTDSKIDDGAVTAAKLAPDAVFERVIVVRADPLDTIGNCDALRDALTGIVDNDADHRYLIHLEPGTFDCGGTALQMKDYVGIQGSGRDFTLITGSVEGFAGLIAAADNSELSRLAVENSDVAADTAIAIMAAADSFRITDVSAVARDSESVQAIVVDDGTAVVTNVTAEALDPTAFSARAIRVLGDSTLELVNVTVFATDGSSPVDSTLDVATGGGLFGSSTVTARNAVFRGGDELFIDQGSTGRFISTQLDGAKDGAGDFICVGAYDGAFAPLNGACD